ncbi:MAG: hypothetical protein II752_00295 [Muribaculaceae bacterium]|nr:hypothetical protein [Muribaculaceae bacterium]
MTGFASHLIGIASASFYPSVSFEPGFASHLIGIASASFYPSGSLSHLRC